jgi:hypothetical protein
LATADRLFARNQMTETLRHPTRHDGNSAVFVTAVVLFATACGFAVWWLMIRSPTRPATAPQTTTVTAVAVSQDGLETLASLGRPIYWAGARPGDTYELTQSAGGKVFVRYLPVNVPVGTPKVYLTIGTYPMANAYAVTRRAAAHPGTTIVPATRGAVAFYRTNLPTNVYMAYPGSDFQVEVFDPTPTEAHELVTSGTIARVAASSGVGSPKTAAAAVSQSGLQKLASRLGRPLYWAGPRTKTTYELTETPDGRVYIRYLPPAATVGTARPYLTVGTYPIPHAFEVTKNASNAPGAVKVKVSGGVAFYDSQRPTSVYVAFTGADEQIEVYDPSASVARAAVSHRLIRAIR